MTPYTNAMEKIIKEYDPIRMSLDNAEDVRNALLYLIWNELFTISGELQAIRDKMP